MALTDGQIKAFEEWYLRNKVFSTFRDVAEAAFEAGARTVEVAVIEEAVRYGKRKAK